MTMHWHARGGPAACSLQSQTAVAMSGACLRAVLHYIPHWLRHPSQRYRRELGVANLYPACTR